MIDLKRRLADLRCCCLTIAALLASATVPAAPITVVDDLGRSVTLQQPARSVISLSPHLTEMLYALEAGDLIQATVRHSDYPEAATRLPQLGDAFSLSIEAVVGYSPDLILAWSTGGNQVTVERLRELGFTVYMNEAASLASIATNLERIGRLVGREAQGQLLAAEFREGLATLRASRSTARRRVFFQISDAQLYTVNDDHLIGEALDVCGADNVFGDLSIPVPMVSFESVLLAEPEIILVASPYPGFKSRWEDEWEKLGWNDKTRYINASLVTRPGFRMLEGIKTLCNLL